MAITPKYNKDKVDKELLLPQNIPDAFDYEYIFHTHPATPDPLNRIKNNHEWF